MFIGHIAVALAAKKLAPKTSLGTLVLGTDFADFLRPILLLFGLEPVRIVPGITRVAPLDFVSYPISHSLGRPPSRARLRFPFELRFTAATARGARFRCACVDE
jgi:hypothetical protein